MCGPIPSCGCMCHRWPYVRHMVACCDAPPVSEDRCYHCGERDDADGDHTCSCPYSDADCPDHSPFFCNPPVHLIPHRGCLLS